VPVARRYAYAARTVVAFRTARDTDAAISRLRAAAVVVTAVRIEGQIRRHAHRWAAVFAERTACRAGANAAVATGVLVSCSVTAPRLIRTSRFALSRLTIVMLARKPGGATVTVTAEDGNVGDRAAAVKTALPRLAVARRVAFRLGIAATAHAAVLVLTLLARRTLIAVTAENRCETGDATPIEASQPRGAITCGATLRLSRGHADSSGAVTAERAARHTGAIVTRRAAVGRASGVLAHHDRRRAC
jgi:hypothetical protein